MDRPRSPYGVGCDLPMQPKPPNSSSARRIVIALCLSGLAFGLILILRWQLAPSIGPGSPPIIGGLAQGAIPAHIRGELLLEELACAQCHEAGPTHDVNQDRQAPDLSAAASRIAPGYLASFLADPHGAKPGTTMPDVMHNWSIDRRAEAAESLVHYLRSRDNRPFSRQPIDPAAAKRGNALFHSIGCVACHAPRDDQGRAADVRNPVPLGRLDQKYSVEGLREFLLAPHAIRPSRRMPDFQLTPREAQDLSNYLVTPPKPEGVEGGEPTSAPVDPQTETLPPLDPELIEQGRELFTELRCAACHEPPIASASPPLPPLHKLDVTQGCLSGDRGEWPFYALTEQQVGDIQTALDPGALPLTDEQRIQVQLLSRNCLACHERNGLGGVLPDRNNFFTSLDAAIGEEGRLPPPLTGVGAKLQHQWLVDSIAHGQGSRPYLQTRMPGFGTELAERLAKSLADLDELPAVELEPLPKDRKLAEEIRKLGQTLVGDKAMNCISCHSFAGEDNGTMTAIDLVASTGRRLRPEWFHHFMLAPFKFRPGSFMPQFFVDGTSVRPNIADGDPDRQIAAMWHYLAEGRNTRKPPGMRRKPIELEVDDQAVMLRRSAQNTGKRGISVGYPRGVNITFDAEALAMNQIWWGRFLDAGGVFHGQGSGQTRPIGRQRATLVKGAPFAALTNEQEAWPEATRRDLGHSFLGYDLDPEQRPTFRYICEDVTITDTPHEVATDAATRPTLRRTLTFSSAADKTLYFRAAVGAEIEPQGETEIRIGKSLLLRAPNGSHLIRGTGEQRELLVRVPIEDGKASLVLDYRWQEDRK